MRDVAVRSARRFELILRGKNRKDTGQLPSNNTINRGLIDTTLRPILRYASKNLEAQVKDIPWTDLRLPEPRGAVTWFTDQQIADWSSSLPVWHRPILRFILRSKSSSERSAGSTPAARTII